MKIAFFLYIYIYQYRYYRKKPTSTVQLGNRASSKSMALSTNPPLEASKSMALSTKRPGELDRPARKAWPCRQNGSIDPPRVTCRALAGPIDPPRATFRALAGSIDPPRATFRGLAGSIDPPRATSTCSKSMALCSETRFGCPNRPCAPCLLVLAR